MLCNQNPDKWRRIAMTEKLLRDVIKEAKEKKQLGIVIWENMGQGNKEVEDLAMEQIAEGKEATMNIKCGFSMPAFIAIPVEKFEAGEKYFFYHIKEVFD